MEPKECWQLLSDLAGGELNAVLGRNARPGVGVRRVVNERVGAVLGEHPEEAGNGVPRLPRLTFGDGCDLSSCGLAVLQCSDLLSHVSNPFKV